MKYLIGRTFLSIATVVVSSFLLTSTSVLAAANGNGNGNSSDGGVANDTNSLKAEIALLQYDVAALAESIAGLGVVTVIADCNANAGALQTAVDAAPAAGAIINVEGSCGSTAIIGKANLLVDGGDIGAGNGVSGSLQIDASRNIQLSGLSVVGEESADACDNWCPALKIANNSSVFLNGDFSAQGSVSVAVNSSLVQLAGAVNITDTTDGLQSAQIRFSNGLLGGFSISRSSSLILATDSSVDSIVLDGSMGVFSGSHFLAQTNDGPVSLTTDTLFVSRTAAAVLAGDTLQLNAPSVRVQQNAVLDVLGMLQENFEVGSLSLSQGGGSRLFLNPSTEQVVAQCDESAWVAGDLNCGE